MRHLQQALALVALDDPKMGAGPGTVVKVSSSSRSATDMLAEHADVHGCVSEKLRVWLVAPDAKIGDRVSLRQESRSAQ